LEPSKNGRKKERKERKERKKERKERNRLMFAIVFLDIRNAAKIESMLLNEGHYKLVDLRLFDVRIRIRIRIRKSSKREMNQ
jgi:hypothetical protein